MARSKGEADLDTVLKKLFPNDTIVSEYPIQVGRTTLFVDRVIHDKKLAFEYDGRQHDEFSEFHHKDAEGFQASKHRDRLKMAWLDLHGYKLVRITHTEKISISLVRKKVLAALK